VSEISQDSHVRSSLQNNMRYWKRAPFHQNMGSEIIEMVSWWKNFWWNNYFIDFLTRISEKMLKWLKSVSD